VIVMHDQNDPICTRCNREPAEILVPVDAGSVAACERCADELVAIECARDEAERLASTPRIMFAVRG